METYYCFRIPNGNIEDEKFVFIVRAAELLLEREFSLFIIHHLEIHVSVARLYSYDGDVVKYLKLIPTAISVILVKAG